MEVENKIKEEVELCKKKKIWIEYKEINEVVENLAKDKEDALKVKSSFEKPMAPVKQALERLEATSKSLNKQTETAVSTNRSFVTIILKYVDHNSLFRGLRAKI